MAITLATNIRISPNAVVDIVRIDLQLANENFDYRLRNQPGEIVVVNFKIEEKNAELDLGFLPEGIYFLEVIGPGKTATKKFLRIGDF